jgi:uncharacterized surface protein with fasciclin (FAS1) repeats
METMRRILSLLITGALMIGLLAAPAAADGHTDAPSIGEIVIEVSSTDGPDKNGKDYDILLAAVLADPVLTDAVLGAGDFTGVDLTVFAPNDNAFKRFTGTDTEADAAAALAGLLGSEALRDIVLYHVVGGEALYSGDVFTDKRWKTNVLTMANGDPLYARDLRLIDGVGNRVFPKLTAVDIAASNGVIHTIKEVILPAADATGNIGETVIAVSGMEGPDDNAHDFDILLAAVLADEVLTSAVLGTGDFAGVDFTVFAPTDRAFMRLTGTSSEMEAAKALGDLIGTEALRDIVLYHVIAGAAVDFETAFATNPYVAKKVEMANGDSIKIKNFRIIDGTKNRIWPKMGSLDIRTTNGLIHTVYEVLLPPAN